MARGFHGINKENRCSVDAWFTEIIYCIIEEISQPIYKVYNRWRSQVNRHSPVVVCLLEVSP